MDKHSRELMCAVVMGFNLVVILGLIYNQKRMNRLNKAYDVETIPLGERRKLLLPMLAGIAGRLTLVTLNIGVTCVALLYRQ